MSRFVVGKGRKLFPNARECPEAEEMQMSQQTCPEQRRTLLQWPKGGDGPLVGKRTAGGRAAVCQPAVWGRVVL